MTGKTTDWTDLECFSPNFSRDSNLCPVGYSSPPYIPSLKWDQPPERNRPTYMLQHSVFHYQKIESILILSELQASLMPSDPSATHSAEQSVSVGIDQNCVRAWHRSSSVGSRASLSVSYLVRLSLESRLWQIGSTRPTVSPNVRFHGVARAAFGDYLHKLLYIHSFI